MASQLASILRTPSRKNQADTEHPAAVVLAVVDRMDDLPVAIESVDQDVRRAAVQSQRDERRTLNQDAQQGC